MRAIRKITLPPCCIFMPKCRYLHHLIQTFGMEKIGIFCSASDSIDRIYFEKTAELGEWMGKEGKTLVYGGSNMGLMECIAQAVKQNGGTIIGVVPTKLEEAGRASNLLDKTIRTIGLSDRKDTMVALSDILVALPGGIGTMDEIFHTLAEASLGYHAKKVILYNINGFYDHLREMLEIFRQRHFIKSPLEHRLLATRDFEELKHLLQ